MVVDGGSADGSSDKIATWIEERGTADWIELLPLAVNGGFGWANNQAIQRLMRRDDPPHFIHMLNPDTEIEPGAVKALADYLRTHPRVAAVGSQLLDYDGSLASSAFNFPSIRSEFARGAGTQFLERLFKIPSISIEPGEAIEVDWVTGGSVMFRVEALGQVGLFDEGFFLYNEEVELMWRLRKAGWSVATEPRSRVRHVGGAATGVSDRKSDVRVQPRWPSYLFRSRSRYFGLTRGPIGAAAAHAAWFAGHLVWRARRLFGFPIGKPIDHEVRDHWALGRPRGHDFRPVRIALDGEPSDRPAWMVNRWQ